MDILVMGLIVAVVVFTILYAKIPNTHRRVEPEADLFSGDLEDIDRAKAQRFLREQEQGSTYSQIRAREAQNKLADQALDNLKKNIKQEQRAKRIPKL
jgi:hypothetical protein